MAAVDVQASGEIGPAIVGERFGSARRSRDRACTVACACARDPSAQSAIQPSVGAQPETASWC